MTGKQKDLLRTWLKDCRVFDGDCLILEGTEVEDHADAIEAALREVEKLEAVRLYCRAVNGHGTTEDIVALIGPGGS